MKRIYFNFMHYFAFTTQDRNGLMVLSGLIILTLLFRVYYPFWLIENTTLPKEQILFADTQISHLKKNEYAVYENDTNRPLKDEYTSAYKGNAEKKYAPKIQKKDFKLYLNTADSLDFQELRGIGQGYARRIIAYRNKLGGFVQKEQLLEVWGIDSVLYKDIVNSIILDVENIEKLNINTIDLQVLKKHPYLDYYQAKEIIKYRDKIGKFTHVNELKKVNLMDAQSFEKLRLYISL